MSRERAQEKIDEWFVGVTEQAFRAAVELKLAVGVAEGDYRFRAPDERLDEFGNVNADLTEVTVVVTRKKGERETPPSTPLTEVVEAVAQHQAAGFSPSTDESSIAQAPDKGKGTGDNK